MLGGFPEGSCPKTSHLGSLIFTCEFKIKTDNSYSLNISGMISIPKLDRIGTKSWHFPALGACYE